MTVLDIFLIGVGLAMDAFAVSICKGLAAPGSQGKTALAIGVSFAGYQMNILLSIAIIGVTTFVISAAGVRIGSVFGTRYQKRAELAGGIILVLIGLKLLLGI